MTYNAPVILSWKLYKDGECIDQAQASYFELPVMVRSCKCVLKDIAHEDAVTKGECPFDTGKVFEMFLST